MTATTRRSAVRDAVIYEPLRTPVGDFGGWLRDVPVQELAATVIRAVVEDPCAQPHPYPCQAS